MTPLIQACVMHFGEMGSRWGINRTVGQIYALLVLSETPLSADDIVEQLLFSRSNVSMGLKELQSWELIESRHIQGDRKEYYNAPDDIWRIAKILLEQRRKREIDPTLSTLRDLLLTKTNDSKELFAQKRMQEMHDMIDMLTQWTIEIQHMDTERLKSLLKLGRSVSKLLDMKDKLIPGGDSKRAE